MKLATLRSSSATSSRIVASRVAPPIGVDLPGCGLGVSAVTTPARMNRRGAAPIGAAPQPAGQLLLDDLGDRGGDGLPVDLGIRHADVIPRLQLLEGGDGLLAGAEGHVLGLAAHGVL